MTTPDVDVVVAVHDPRRPVDRAVRSALDQEGCVVRVTVVCHNTDPAGVGRRLSSVPGLGRSDRVRLLHLADGIPSPAGPFNLGIDRADAPFVSIMGSDDRLEPGAIRSWLAVARRCSAEAVVPRLVHAAGDVVPTPPVRPGRCCALDPVRDRLSYRSAPLGLVSTDTVGRLGLRMREGLRVGEDVAFATSLWFGARVAFDRRGPAYVIGDDAVDRVTYAPRSIADELAFVGDLVGSPWFAGLSLDARRAVAVKLARIHLFGAVFHRQDPAFWTDEERSHLRLSAEVLDDAAPGFDRVLSFADRRLLDMVRAAEGTTAELVAAAVARRRHGRPSTLVPRDIRRLLDREAPLRLMAASILTRR